MCDVCKSIINNLPEVTPPAPGTDAGSDAGNSLFDDMDDRNHTHPLHGAFAADQMPGSADIVFDCIRVCTPFASLTHQHNIVESRISMPPCCRMLPRIFLLPV